MDPKYQAKDGLCSANVASLTTYELRQELELRGKMDLAEGTINHKSLLQRLVQELVGLEAQAAQTKGDSDAARLHEQRDADKALREQRKAEALERSRQRQADPSYFAKRAELNKDGKELLDAKKAPPDAPAATAEQEEEEEEAAEAGPSDPFRTTKTKGPKIFVK